MRGHCASESRAGHHRQRDCDIGILARGLSGVGCPFSDCAAVGHFIPSRIVKISESRAVTGTAKAAAMAAMATTSTARSCARVSLIGAKLLQNVMAPISALASALRSFGKNLTFV